LDNNTDRIGHLKGQQAVEFLLNMGKTKFSFTNLTILPINARLFTNSDLRYIYTEKGGWIDMAHFMFYAGKAYKYKLDGNENPIQEAVEDGYLQEKMDPKRSKFSYEDLPSDKYGAEFAVKYFDPNSKLTISQQIQNYLNNILKATDPSKAPNYDDLPTSETQTPTWTNETTTPMFLPWSKMDFKLKLDIDISTKRDNTCIGSGIGY
jgi:hypothetical protein